MKFSKAFALAAPWGAVAVAVCVDPFAGVLIGCMAVFATIAISLSS